MFPAAGGTASKTDTGSSKAKWWPVYGTFAIDAAGNRVWFIDRTGGNTPMRFYRILNE